MKLKIKEIEIIVHVFFILIPIFIRLQWRKRSGLDFFSLFMTKPVTSSLVILNKYCYGLLFNDLSF